MASSNKSYTPPKGKPTAARNEDVGRSRRIPPMLEWIILGLVIVGVLIAAFIFATRGDGSSPHSGAPSELGAAAVVSTTTG